MIGVLIIEPRAGFLHVRKDEIVKVPEIAPHRLCQDFKVSTQVIEAFIDFDELGIDLIETPVDLIETPVDLLEPRVDLLEPRVDLIELRIDPIEAFIDTHFEAL